MNVKQKTNKTEACFQRGIAFHITLKVQFKTPRLMESERKLRCVSLAALCSWIYIF